MNNNRNMQDPAVQEKIRRGPHVYVPGTDGQHGSYVEKPYIHQEYPKLMGHFPPPERKLFKSDEEFWNAMKEWEIVCAQNTVNSKTEEDTWREEHPEDKRKTKVA